MNRNELVSALTEMTQQPSLDFTAHQVLVMAADPCEKRHKNNPQSIEAHKRVLPAKVETYNRIMEFVKRQGSYGATVHEIAIALGFGNAINRASPRLTELKAAVRLKESGEKRNGAAVLILV